MHLFRVNFQLVVEMEVLCELGHPTYQLNCCSWLTPGREGLSDHLVNTEHVKSVYMCKKKDAS